MEYDFQWKTPFNRGRLLIERLSMEDDYLLRDFKTPLSHIPQLWSLHHLQFCPQRLHLHVVSGQQDLGLMLQLLECVLQMVHLLLYSLGTDLGYNDSR